MRKSPDPGQNRQPVFSKSRCSGVVLGLVAAGLFAAAFHGPPAARPDVRDQPPETKVQLSGKAASDYLTQTTDGRSLRQAVIAARFGLQWQEHSPADKTSGGGYLGMSHNQNLNAWFGEEGVTVRPTLPEEKRDQAWSTALHLKAYGYGQQLADVPPIVSRKVSGNRIEYHREDQAGAIAHLASRISHLVLTEWYENGAEGIEQGFTLNERPERGGGVAPNEPLRVSLAMTGDLHAISRNERTIEFVDASGNGTLSYSRLISKDADGKELTARMEASADGREIMLVVEDASARYPIVIDPIVASLERILDGGIGRQVGAEFGDAVAIDGDVAAVGAWREDYTPKSTYTDAGYIYVFGRTGNAWSLRTAGTGGTDNEECGYSVAISGSRVVYGCRGFNNNTGRAFVLDVSNGTTKELIPNSVLPDTGDLYGASVAINGANVFVGAPLTDFGSPNSGTVFQFRVNSDGTVQPQGAFQINSSSGAQFGASISTDGLTLVIGEPAVGVGKVIVRTLTSDGSVSGGIALQSSDGAPGDLFGQSVAVSGNTVVVGAGFNDEKGTDAGAAYVFVRDASGQWSQQQKLTASDARAGDLFGHGNPAVAIQGNTIVVGARNQDAGFSDPNDNRGTAYVFTRNLTTWTQQTRIRVATFDGGAPGNAFGCSVTMSGDTVIVGAQHAPAFGPNSDGTSNTGAAYVYRLDCTPPYGSGAAFQSNTSPAFTACPGETVNFSFYANIGTSPTSLQWRHNGVNIPGATSGLYRISKVSASDAGGYDLVVSNSCGGEISTPVALTIHTFNLSPTSQNFGVSGSNGIVNVTSTGSCSWTAASNSPFITINSGGSGTGNGTVGFTVAANPNSGQRTGTLTIAGLTFTVSQDGTNCSYSIAPTSKTLSASASTNTVSVTTSAGCAWTATSNDPSFLSINSGASGTGNGTVTYTIAANFSAAQRTGTLTIAGQTFTVIQAGAPPTVLANISTRLRVETGDSALIGGIIVTGSQPKKIIVRAIGPSLSFADKLADPILELHDASGALLETNDNWGDSPNEQAIIDSTIPPSNPLESAVVRSVAPGNYTAIVRGVNNGTGIGVVEAYDLDTSANSKLANISTRGLVQTGDNVLIAGTIVVGQTSQKVILRGIGPSLSVPGKLADPTLELRDGNGALLEGNDNWQDSPNKQAIIDSTIPPGDPLESAIVRTLAPGNYTAILRGVNNATGIAVVEVYALN